jgi:hypothetical protein
MPTAGTPANVDPVTLPAPSGGVTRGLTYIVGDNFAVAMETVGKQGDPFQAVVAGPVWAAKDPTVSIAACAKVYLDEATGLITSDSAETEIGGFALALASTPDGAVAIMLGQPAPVIPAGLTGFTGASNTALGTGAGDAITSGTRNTMVGVDAGGDVVGALDNTAVGYAAGIGTGASNVAVGAFALGGQTTGQRNVAVGRAAGNEVTTGEGNIFLGFQAGEGLGNVSNTLAAGNAAAAVQDITIVPVDAALGSTFTRRHRFYQEVNFRLQGAPADAFLQNASVTAWLDEAANKLMFKVKYADGTTIKSGEIALV